MNIFIVAHLGSELSGQELIGQLPCISYKQGHAVPVIVVDDRYNLSVLPAACLPLEYAQFNLSDFLHDGLMCVIDEHKIVKAMDEVKSGWVFIDFGLYDEIICSDFIFKLSRYSYFSPALRGCNLVFTMPSMSLSILAQAANRSFNNLQASGAESDQSRALGRLFLSAYIGRLFSGLSLAMAGMRHMHNLFMRVSRRLTNSR